MIELTTVTGSETRTLALNPLRTTSVKAVAFRVRPNGFEEPLFVSDRSRQRILGGTRLGEHGSWIMSEFRLDEDSIVKFFVSRQETGYVKRCFGVYLLVAPEHPILTLRSPGIDQGGGSNTIMSIRGQCRILRPEEFSGLGIKVQPNLLRFYERSEEEFEVLIDRSSAPSVMGGRLLDLES